MANSIGRVREQMGRDERWAIALELATAVRVVSTYAAEGDGRRTADLTWTHRIARSLAACPPGWPQQSPVPARQGPRTAPGTDLAEGEPHPSAGQRAG